ncbi:MAG: PilN domain-containing protein [Patescibacteria group bacterium]
MSARAKFGVNLLPQTELDASVWGKILKWALSTGRYIVILTELVVIAAFLSRFKLDKDYSDLGDRITGKKSILTALQNTETKFRTTQNQLAAAKRVIDTSLPAGELLDTVTSQVPPGVTLTSIVIDAKGSAISGTAQNDRVLAVFLDRLVSSELTGLTADNKGEIKFSLKLRN